MSEVETQQNDTNAINNTSNDHYYYLDDGTPIPKIPSISFDQMKEYHRLFYTSLGERYAKITTKPQFLTKDEYDFALDTIKNWKTGESHDAAAKAAYRKYTYVQASYDSALRSKNKGDGTLKIAQKDNIFDIIIRSHAKTTRHVVDSRPVYNLIKKEYYGITEDDVKLCISLCPICVASRTIITAKQVPQKMIISPTIGDRAVMDLIDMSSSPDPITGDKWILRLIDHHSGYGQVRAQQRKTAEITSVNVIQICCAMPEFDIIQSDNGGEFLGKTIKRLNK